MLEVLSGRLTWERIGQSIRVVIPVRPGALGVIYGGLIVVWLVIATVRNWVLLSSPHQKDTEFTLQMIAMGIYVVGFFYFVWWLAWTFTGETIVTLDPVQLKIQRRILGIEWSEKSFKNHQVDRMFYVAPGKSWSNPIFSDPGSGRIQFRADNIIHSFAKGLIAAEANTLLEEMLKIYAFPRSYYN